MFSGQWTVKNGGQCSVIIVGERHVARPFRLLRWTEGVGHTNSIKPAPNGVSMKSQQRFSFELFPPRTPEATAKLPAVIKQLAAMGPDYFSVTYGAGGSDQDGTYQTLMTVVEQTGV